MTCLLRHIRLPVPEEPKPLDEMSVPPLTDPNETKGG